MTPKVVRGRSFKGVGQYLLHDKNASSSERVVFTETMNLPTDNANAAIAHMIDTATHSDDLKRMAGVSLKGQKQQRPVYHYSLAWHPSENVTMDVQMEAARESLKALGIDDRQALIVGHNDAKHPHVHVVVNLVSTENGKFPSLSKDYLKFSEWAQEYERKRGVIFCKERVENNERRKDGFVKDQSMTRQEWMAWKKAETKEIWDSFRADRAKAKESRKGQYDALWRQKEERMAQRKDEIKAVFKPHWRDLFKRQRIELANFDAGFFDRLGFALTRNNRSKIVGLVQALTNDGDLRGDFIRKQGLDKKKLGDQHKNRVADASREVNKAWKFDLNELKEMHSQQDQKSYDATKAKSAEIWGQDISQTGQDFEDTADRRKDKPKRKTFMDKMRETTSEKEMDEVRKQARQRTKRTRNRGKGRGRSLDR